MVVRHHLYGYEEFSQFVETLAECGGPAVFFLFCGSTDANGVNWCPWCVTAQPVVETGLELAPSDSLFVHVTVGERDYWKDPLCPFRTDERTKLVWVPTLLRWNSTSRVDSRDVSDAEKVNQVFRSN